MKTDYDFSNGVPKFVAPHQPESQANSSKTRINLYLDKDILIALRKRADLSGKCYETVINETLRQSLYPDAAPLTVEVLRRILKEELNAIS